MNTSEKFQFYFLLAIIIVVSILSIFIFSPFLNALILAVVFSVMFNGLYRNILGITKNNESLSSLATIVIVVVLVVGPILFLGLQIFQEAQGLYITLLEKGGDRGILSVIDMLSSSLSKTFPILGNLSFDVDQYLKETLSLFSSHLGGFFSSFAKILTSAFLFMIALYYMLKDGKRIHKYILKLSPLPDTYDEAVLDKLSLAVKSVMFGSISVAAIQGLVAATGYYIFGVPSAVLWGTVTAVSALIPAIGTSLILVPAILFLFLSGQTFSGIGLLIWGAIAVGTIDNFVGPKLVGRGMELHPLIVFISVIGGIIFFGPLGFLLGPLTLNLLIVLLDIYSQVTKE
jgi:predicted PurR-regulated permease PerM